MEDHNKEKIARLVKESRMNKGYTQQGLSELAGISLRSIQRIENAEVLPRTHTLKILSQHLGFSPERLGDEPSPEPVAAQQPVHALLSVETFLLRRLNSKQRIILSFGIGVVMALLFQAFLAQSSRFPETDFELLLLLAGTICFYILMLLFIWK